MGILLKLGKKLNNCDVYLLVNIMIIDSIEGYLDDKRYKDHFFFTLGKL